jgi:spermidine/putrescine transport system ATP-binding protein
MLELRGIEKSFSSQKALHPIHLKIESGEFFCLLGPSGSGKTTLLRILAGLESASSGEIWLERSRIDSLEARYRPFNTVFQSYALFPHLNVYDNIAFGPKMHGYASRDLKDNIDRMLSLVDLKGFGHRLPSTLSGGQAQRVAMARALINQPRVLLLDEPLSALDPQLRGQMRTELKRIQRESKTTFVMVTHDREEAMALADRIALLREGQLAQVGTPTELYQRPVSRFVSRFLSRVNELKIKPFSENTSGNVDPTNLSSFVVELEDGTEIKTTSRRLTSSKASTTAIIYTPAGMATAAPTVSAATNTLSFISIRPENISILAENDIANTDSLLNQIKGKIRSIEFLGSRLDIRVEISTGELVWAESPTNNATWKVDQQVVLNFGITETMLLPENGPENPSHNDSEGAIESTPDRSTGNESSVETKGVAIDIMNPNAFAEPSNGKNLD